MLRREWGSVEPAAGTAWAMGATVLLGMLLWIAADLRLGRWWPGGFAVALGVFALAAWAVLGALGRLRSSAMGGGWRYGIAGLRRRMGGSVIQVVALGIGLSACCC